MMKALSRVRGRARGVRVGVGGGGVGPGGRGIGAGIGGYGIAWLYSVGVMGGGRRGLEEGRGICAGSGEGVWSSGARTTGGCSVGVLLPRD
jgi:hypothetical protein